MKRQTVLAVTVFAVMCSVSLAGRAKKAAPGVSLTIYNDNFAVVRETRQMQFHKGINTVRFTDVASAIDPASVKFRCLSAPGAVSILEQSYEYDVVATHSLLNSYIGRNVTVTLRGSGADTGREVTGVLLSAAESDYYEDIDLILKTESNDIEVLKNSGIEGILLKEPPVDLVTKPTLVWLADAKKKGQQLCEVSYITEKVKWDAVYSAVLSADESKLELSGWVTIDNRSGASYKDAVIKLVAGDVRRVVEADERRVFYEAAALKAPARGGFEEKPFMEYHLYTLGRRSTINNNQAKQIEFITPAVNVSTKKVYVYDRGRQQALSRNKQREKIQINIEFENTRENNLGIALPSGKMQVFKRDPSDESLEFIGEDRIDHTPGKDKVLLYIGDAFDIVPEQTLLESKRTRRMRLEKHKIELRNRKDEAVEIYVDEKFPPNVNWTIEEATHEYERRDAYTARFTVKIDADSTETVQYTATQTW